MKKGGLNSEQEIMIFIIFCLTSTSPFFSFPTFPLVWKPSHPRFKLFLLFALHLSSANTESYSLLAKQQQRIPLLLILIIVACFLLFTGKNLSLPRASRLGACGNISQGRE
jgi:hypothetical protein